MKTHVNKLIFILLQLLLTVTVFAQSYKYTSTSLNLRNGAGTSYRILGTIPAGTSVEMAEDCDCVWIRVYYNGKIGYVSSRYLSDRQPTNYKRYHSRTYTKHTNSTTKYYTNSTGERVQSPTYYNAAPEGATALCGDRTYSFSRNRRGTCSHHGGVARWLR